ncbi:hypothetical protein D9M71_814620 [compost metagenome]
MLGNVRDVFHGYQMRFGFFDEPAEVIEQRPLAIAAGVFALVVGRKRLTGGATGQ